MTVGSCVMNHDGSVLTWSGSSRCRDIPMGTSFSASSDGLNTPNSVTIPPVISDAGVTSKAGFQQLIPKNNKQKKPHKLIVYEFVNAYAYVRVRASMHTQCIHNHIASVKKKPSVPGAATETPLKWVISSWGLSSMWMSFPVSRCGSNVVVGQAT